MEPPQERVFGWPPAASPYIYPGPLIEWSLVILVTLTAFRLGVIYAYLERGYQARGGEVSLPPDPAYLLRREKNAPRLDRRPPASQGSPRKERRK